MSNKKRAFLVGILVSACVDKLCCHVNMYAPGHACLLHVCAGYINMDTRSSLENVTSVSQKYSANYALTFFV